LPTQWHGSCTATAAPPPAASLTLGSYSVGADGRWSYTLNNAAVQHLAVGKSTTDSFTGHQPRRYAFAVVTVTSNGTNDPAIVSTTRQHVSSP